MKKVQQLKLTPEVFICNGEFSIKGELFVNLRNLYDKEDIKNTIVEAIRKYKIPFPSRKYTDEDAKKSYEDLCRLDWRKMISREMVTDAFTRYPHKFPAPEYCIVQSNVGNNASNRFQIKNRLNCSSDSFPTPYKIWKDDNKLKTVLNALFSLKLGEKGGTIKKAQLFSSLNLKYYVAAQFKPSVAKCIYELFQAKSVLDISSGWGDRLAGFYAAENTLNYVGHDPNRDLFKGYLKQIQFYDEIRKTNGMRPKSAMISCLPFEKTSFIGQFDICFTSPPYFDKEKYSKHKGQSFKNFTGFEMWMHEFLYKSIDIAIRSLKPDGYLIINIEDVYSKNTINEICDDMVDYTVSRGMFFAGSLGMIMSKRPNSKSSRKGSFVEPMWVFSKVETTLQEIIENSAKPKSSFLDGFDYDILDVEDEIIEVETKKAKKVVAKKPARRTVENEVETKKAKKVVAKKPARRGD